MNVRCPTCFAQYEDVEKNNLMLIRRPTSFVVKTGYPPKPLLIDSSSAQSSLESLGIKDGEQIMTSERPDGSVSSFDFGSSGALSGSTVTPAAPTPQAAAAAPQSSGFRPPKAVGGLAFGTRPLIPLSGGQSAFQPRPVTGAQPFGGLSTVDSSFRPTAPIPASNPSTGSSGNVESVRVRDQGILVVRVSPPIA